MKNIGTPPGVNQSIANPAPQLNLDAKKAAVEKQEKHLKHLDISMNDKDFAELKDTIKNGKVSDFIAQYQAQYPNLSLQDVVSLGLDKAIQAHEFILIGQVFDILYKNNVNSLDPIVTLDANGKNAILYALEEASGIRNLSTYILHLTKQQAIREKFVLENNLKDQYKQAIHQCKSGSHPQKLIDELIKPIYTDQSVEELVEAVGRDWLDSYYL